jgi:hypothetical protein
MGKKIVVLLVVFTMFLAGCVGKSNTGSSSSSSSSNNLGSALNLVIGSDSDPSVFSSYHIDVALDTPQLSDDGTSVVNQKTQISADVAGKDVHILQTDPGATDQKEGFIIGDQDYKMVGGMPQSMMGQVSLSWAMWPLQVVMAYAYPVYFAKKSGTDSIDGRKADVYTFDSADASAASNSVMNAMGMENSTTGKGTVWIDQQTGAMLKLDMTYTNSVTDNNQKVIGTGNGAITIEVTKVDQVTVTSPVN